MESYETDRFYFEKATVEEDSGEEYEEVIVEEHLSASNEEEGLKKAIQFVKDAEQDNKLYQKDPPDIPKSHLIGTREVIDDFIRNFLVDMDMMETFDTFQNEWFSMINKNDPKCEKMSELVPDAYIQISNLNKELIKTKSDLVRSKKNATTTKDAFEKLIKERDHHRMHHKRVVQEKDRIMNDLKKLRDMHVQNDFIKKDIQSKYDACMREKMLISIERDRIAAQVSGLENTIRSISNLGKQVVKPDLDPDTVNKSIYSPRHKKDSKFPHDSGVNPLLAGIKPLSNHLIHGTGYKVGKNIQAHSNAVTSIAIHPKKNVAVTTSDDHTWKMWTVPYGDLIMTGQGHENWVSGCDFNPEGNKLATVSGDKTLKIWSLAKNEIIHTFSEHGLQVWACSWHSCGDFIATASLDKTAKIWDLNSLRCRYTLRGHLDSVNNVKFVPFSNTVITCSTDKSLSLWDGRTGLVAQTFYGHFHSVNHFDFNMTCDRLASCDSSGVVNIWDIRMVSQSVTINCGPTAANKVSYDPTNSLLAVASDDETVKLIELTSNNITNLSAHASAVQCVAFDRSGEMLLSGSNDKSMQVWC